MPRIKAPPLPRLNVISKSEAIQHSNNGDDSYVLDQYRRRWHQFSEQRRSLAPLGFSALAKAKSLSSRGFDKDNFSRWVHGNFKPTGAIFRRQLTQLADYLWDELDRMPPEDVTPTMRNKTRPSEEFIKHWYDAVDLGAGHIEAVRSALPGIYRLFRASSFNPQKITSAAMIIWEDVTREKESLLRTLEFNQFMVEDVNRRRQTPIAISEKYHGALIRKKSWLLLESFLEKEGDPQSYRFALPHDQLLNKYQCLVGYCTVFPTAPIGMPTIRAAVLERVDSLKAKIANSDQAEKYLIAEMKGRCTDEDFKIDLLDASDIPKRIFELLSPPQIEQWLVRAPRLIGL